MKDLEWVPVVGSAIKGATKFLEKVRKTGERHFLGLFVPKGTALTNQSFIIDSNIAIALQKQAAALPLQKVEQKALDLLKQLGVTDLRITSIGAREITNAHQFGRLIANTSHADYTQLLKVLKDANVGGVKGLADRLLVAETFFAGGSQRTLITSDKGVYNKLATIAGYDLSKLGKSVALAFPNGFKVTINGRTILVIPVGG